MFVTPFRYTYQPDELSAEKNKLQFKRGCQQQSVWELHAYAVYVYKFSNVIQVVGDWYEKGTTETIKGVLNFKLSEKDLYQARYGNLTASEITSLPWEDWFIYRIDKKEGDNEKNSFNYNEAR